MGLARIIEEQEETDDFEAWGYILNKRCFAPATYDADTVKNKTPNEFAFCIFYFYTYFLRHLL